MEIFIGILVLIAVIMIIASILDNPKSAVKQPLGDFSEPKLKFEAKEEKEHQETTTRLQIELTEKLAKDTTRYVVEATTKDGTVFTTTEFEPSGYVDNWYAHYASTRPYANYTSSRQYAEQFVANAQNNGTRLVQFGDDYVCISTITKVRLVKTKE